MIRIYIYKTPYALPDHTSTSRKPKRKKDDIDALSIHRSIRRTKSTIADLVLCNNFEYFCTFTFDPRKVDRYDVGACRTAMSLWLHRQRLHSPNFKYLIVPEFHKKCQACVESNALECTHDNVPKALHFHALISDFNGKLKDSGKMQNGRKVYNMTGYRKGFTTAVPIDHNTVAVSNYIKKYITKEMPLIHGKKRYWISNNLIRPTKTINAFASLKNLPLFTKKVYEAEYYDVYEAMKV